MAVARARESPLSLLLGGLSASRELPHKQWEPPLERPRFGPATSQKWRLPVNTVKQTLARATEKFALRLFRSPRLRHITRLSLDRTGSWHQRECPLKAPFVFSFVVAMGLFRNDSLRILLKRLLEMERERRPGLCPRAVTPEAICKARKRLRSEPLREGFEITTRKVRPRCWFGGLRVYALDGTKADMPDTPSNEAAFGRPPSSRGHSAFPQALLLGLVDVATHRLKGASIHPGAMDERAASLPLLERLGQRDLLLLDRGYAAAWYFHELDQREIPFVVRSKTGWKPRRLHQLRDGSWMVEGRGDPPKSKSLRGRWSGPRKVRYCLRMIEYRVGESPVIRLLTNLLDPDAYPADRIATLYAQRWEGELVFDEIKNHLATVTHGKLRTIFRSKSPGGVEQEAWGLLLSYNLVRETMLQAARRQKLDPLHLSFVGSVGCIRRTLPRIHRAPTRRHRELFLQLLGDIASELIPRPRREVAYPRKKKRKMSNFGVKKPHHKAEPRTKEVLILTDQDLWDV
jgi:hypothetical protein